MRDETEIREMRELASVLIENACPEASADGLRGVRDALDWALGDTDEPPVE